jgi:hypothetical protein
MATDEFSARYDETLTGSYDGVDRIVLNAYNPLCHNPAGSCTGGVGCSVTTSNWTTRA